MMSLSKQFTRREKVLLSLLALLLVGAAYFFAVHQPVVNALDALKVQQSDAENQLMVLEAKAVRLEDMRAELEKILAQPNAAETPRYDNLQQLMLFLNAILGSASDYSLSFQPIEMPEDGAIVRRVIDMNFTCPSYENARGVLEDLRDCAFRCQLGKLSLTPGEDAGDLEAGPVRVSLTLTFFESMD